MIVREHCLLLMTQLQTICSIMHTQSFPVSKASSFCTGLWTGCNQENKCRLARISRNGTHIRWHYSPRLRKRLIGRIWGLQQIMLWNDLCAVKESRTLMALSNTWMLRKTYRQRLQFWNPIERVVPLLNLFMMTPALTKVNKTPHMRQHPQVCQECHIRNGSPITLCLYTADTVQVIQRSSLRISLRSVNEPKCLTCMNGAWSASSIPIICMKI